MNSSDSCFCSDEASDLLVWGATANMVLRRQSHGLELVALRVVVPLDERRTVDYGEDDAGIGEEEHNQLERFALRRQRKHVG